MHGVYIAWLSLCIFMSSHSMKHSLCFTYLCHSMCAMSVASSNYWLCPLLPWLSAATVLPLLLLHCCANSISNLPLLSPPPLLLSNGSLM